MGMTREDIASLVSADIEERIAFQDRKSVRFIANSAIVPANGSVELAINVSNEGDFLSEFLTGRIVPSDYQTFYGITIQAFDNTRTELIQKCAADTVLSPGYGIALLQQVEFKHLFERSGVIRFILGNSSGVDQTVHLTLRGERLR